MGCFEVSRSRSRSTGAAVVIAALALLSGAATVNAGFADVVGAEPSFADSSFAAASSLQSSAEDHSNSTSAVDDDREQPALSFDAEDDATEPEIRTMQVGTHEIPARATVAAPLPPAVVSGAVLLAGNLLAARLMKRRLV